MATFEFLALATDETKRRMAHMFATGKSFKATGFTVGNQGHDPSDPFNARTPNTSMLVPPDQTVFPPLPFTSVDESSGPLNPQFTCDLPAGQGTGIVSSVYLWGTVVYDPTRVLPSPMGVFQGVTRFIDLPASANNIGDIRHVLADDLDYYWNGMQWLPLTERFLLAIANAPQLIKLDTQADSYIVSAQL